MTLDKEGLKMGPSILDLKISTLVGLLLEAEKYREKIQGQILTEVEDQ